MTNRRRILTGLAAALAVVVAGAFLMPHRPALGAPSGDADLLEMARPLLGNGHSKVSITLVDTTGTRTAHFGATDETPYEIGSITKTMTSMLLADAVRRGEVALDDTLGTYLDLGDAPAAGVTLAELASHRSGLPRVGGGVGTVVRGTLSAVRHRNPYVVSPAGLVEQARDASVGDDRGTVSYSNFGAALLGQALAAATGTDYRTLLRERLLDPLGMSDSGVPRDESEASTHGWATSGAAEQPWVLDGDAPAGGVRSTASDMGRFITGLLDETAPGTDALEPRWDAGDGDRIGLAWFTDSDGLTSHNGGTGGYRSIVILDREQQRGVAVLADTAVDVDDLGHDILAAASRSTEDQR